MLWLYRKKRSASLDSSIRTDCGAVSSPWSEEGGHTPTGAMGLAVSSAFFDDAVFGSIQVMTHCACPWLARTTRAH